MEQRGPSRGAQAEGPERRGAALPQTAAKPGAVPAAFTSCWSDDLVSQQPPNTEQALLMNS